MDFGKALGIVGKAVAKTGLTLGSVTCMMAEQVVDEAIKKGRPNTSEHSYEEQKGFWRSATKKLEDLNDKIKF